LHPKVQETSIMTQTWLRWFHGQGENEMGDGGGGGPHPPSQTKTLHQFLSDQEVFVE